MGVALWASVSDEVDARLAKNLDAPIRLHPNEWASGDHFWIVDVIGDPRVVRAMIAGMKERVFKDKIFKFRMTDKDGKTIVKVVEPGSSDQYEKETATVS